MMKRLYLMFAGLILACGNLFAAIEPVNNRVQGEALYDLSLSGTHDLSDNKYWMVEGGIWSSFFDIQSVKNRIIFGIDESNLAYHAAEYSYRITFDVAYEELVNGTLTPKTFDDISLLVNYDPARGSQYQDRGVFAFTGGLNVVISNVLIEYETTIGGGGWTTVTGFGEEQGKVHGALYLESEIVTERYYEFNPNTIPSTNMTVTISGDEALVSWPFMEGAEDYDLEWAWVSTYDPDVVLDEGDVSFDFNLNATGVRLSGQNTYSIPLIYGDGFIVLRYRGVGRSGENYTIPVEGSWSTAGTVYSGAGLVASAPNYFAVDAHEDNLINYGAGMSFIENGVNSVGVTYMDGVLKPRQSQAKLNGQDKIIVGSTIYDHYGRPAIGVMSTPVDQSSLGYVENLNMYKNGSDPAVPYEKQHFDLDQELLSCSSEAIPGMDAASSAGAAHYYSPENADQEGYNAYLPDAAGYPFVQVQYTPDATGRIKKVGGIGPDHQLGATAEGDPHYTQYFYVTPDDDELWALFGNDAARPENYTKVITRDVHGQISIALIDGMGRTVATYMEGSAPDGLDVIEGNDGPSDTGKDFMPYNQNLGNGVLEVQTPFVVLDPTVVYTFNYDFTGTTFNECLPENICYDCLYDLTITIMPAEATAAIITDGEETPVTLSNENGIYTFTRFVGNIESFDTDCDDPLVFSEEFPDDSSFNLKFSCIGEYYVIKTLTVSEAPIDYYWEQYQEQNTCLLNYDDFFDNSLAQVDWTQCDSYDPCEFNFILEHGTLEEWLVIHPGGEETYEDLKNEYLADCGTMSSCDIMLPLLLQDMSPGGQYGSTDNSDNLSVYNTGVSNDLGGDYLDVTFLNEDGSIAYVDSDGDLIEDDLPQTLSLEDFFIAFQPSWAMALIEFHPEYCYYEFCLDFPELAEYEQDMFAIETFADACAYGYINPAEDAGYFDLPACVTDVPDPIFAAVYPGDQTTVDDIMNALYDTYDIYTMAVVMSGDVSTTTFGSGCNADKHWENFRILYMSKRFQVLELIKDTYIGYSSCDHIGCIGDASCTGDPFNASSPRYFDFGSTMGYDYLTYAGSTDWDAAGGEAETNIGEMCSGMCTEQAAIWMEQLVGCGDQLTYPETWAPGQTTYEYVYDELIEICAGGCSGGCFDLTQQDPAVTTNTGADIFASFEDLIDFKFELTETCSHLLITHPIPGACDEPVGNNLDKCACEMLLFTATEDPEAFEAMYGFLPENYGSEYCQCETYDANSNNILAGAEITALDAAEILTPTDYGCPRTCIRCEQLTQATTGLLAQFEAEYSLEYDENPSLFTAYINDAAGSSFTYQELADFVENCLAFQLGVNEPMYNLLDPKAAKIRALLEKLNQDDLTTGDTYNHTQLPEYFYSGLYSCTDQATATYTYSPTISSDVLSFTAMAPGCVSSPACTLTLDIVGSIPVYFANATEYFQNILSFDEMFITDLDISPTVLNVFHIRVTLDNQSGGTEEGELLVTSCHDITNMIQVTTPIGFYSTFELCPALPQDEGNPCMQNLIEQAALDAQMQYEAYLEEQYALFVASYKSTCALVTDEAFSMEYQANRYHYTLLYYDQSGNLVKTVPPKGVHALVGIPLQNAKAFAEGIGTAVYPDHDFETRYKHNSLNQVVEVTTPDGGTSHYWYDQVGRLVVSQNAKQAETHPLYGVALYAYTKYDELGRVYEVGEVMNNEPMTNTISKDPTDLQAWIDSDFSNGYFAMRNYITRIHYDEAFSSDAANEFMLEDADITTVSGYGHTRNRIVAVEFLEGYQDVSGWVPPATKYVSHYRYDIHGNVQSYLQESVSLATYNQPFTRVDYEYDLISGNPQYIWYQKGKPDQYIHHYTYDADNRLKEVFTSNDAQIWDRDVNYEYREDGYLARTELGEMKVQGMDYAYTLHGWIKTLNSGVLDATNDMGKDGDIATSGTAEYDFYENDIHALHARDALSYTVGYYSGDYTQISAGVTGYSNMPVALAGTLATDIDELFNGNITSYMAGTTETDGDKLAPLATAYHYDQLHRFTESHVFTHSNITATNSTASAVRSNTTGPGGLGDYEMHVAYDPNGNITELVRMAYGTANGMDEFEYHYEDPTHNNKLDYVTESTFDAYGLGYGDIELSQSADNYTYYADGSLKSDWQENIALIEWYPNGLVQRITRLGTNASPDLYFEYDAMGNRTLKVEMTRNGTTFDMLEPHAWNYTHYAYDANGMVMATYRLELDEEDPAVLRRIETMLYGGSRLGMETTAAVVSEEIDYLNACNNDGLATGIIQLGAFTPTTGVLVEVLVNGNELAQITWNTSNSIAFHGAALVSDINAQALGYSATLIDMGGYVYIQLKETVAGSLAGQVLMVELNNTETPSYVRRELTIGECQENRTLGNKVFELSNYLGNVMEVIADRKIAHSNGASAPQTNYFEADVVSYADYYPFGMTLPGRNGSIADYRFGAFGYESDPEVSGQGNSYTTEFRQYDPRLGRWKSLDPLMYMFPSISPYVAFDNNPVYYIDPFGLSSEGGPDKTVPRSGEPTDQTVNDDRAELPAGEPEGTKVVYDYADSEGHWQFTYVKGEGGTWSGTASKVESNGVRYEQGFNGKTHFVHHDGTPEGDNATAPEDIANNQGGTYTPPLDTTKDPASGTAQTENKVEVDAIGNKVEDTKTNTSINEVNTPSTGNNVRVIPQNNNVNRFHTPPPPPLHGHQHTPITFDENDDNIEVGRQQLNTIVNQIVASYNATPNKAAFIVTVNVGSDNDGLNINNVRSRLVGNDENGVITPYSGTPYSNLLAGRYREIARALIQAGIPANQIRPGAPIFGTRNVTFTW